MQQMAEELNQYDDMPTTKRIYLIEHNRWPQNLAVNQEVVARRLLDMQ